MIHWFYYSLFVINHLFIRSQFNVQWSRNWRSLPFYDLKNLQPNHKVVYVTMYRQNDFSSFHSFHMQLISDYPEAAANAWPLSISIKTSTICYQLNKQARLIIIINMSKVHNVRFMCVIGVGNSSSDLAWYNFVFGYLFDSLFCEQSESYQLFIIMKPGPIMAFTSSRIRCQRW